MSVKYLSPEHGKARSKWNAGQAIWWVCWGGWGDGEYEGHCGSIHHNMNDWVGGRVGGSILCIPFQKTYGAMAIITP